jgi:hypothetical protein
VKKKDNRLRHLRYLLLMTLASLLIKALRRSLVWLRLRITAMQLWQKQKHLKIQVNLRK